MSKLTEADAAELDVIEREATELRAKLQELEARRKRILLAPWRVEVGTVVRGTARYARDKLCLVTIVREPFHRSARPWLTAKVQAENGKFGRKVNLMDDWQYCDDTLRTARKTEGLS